MQTYKGSLEKVTKFCCYAIPTTEFQPQKVSRFIYVKKVDRKSTVE